MHHRHAELLLWQPAVIISVWITQCCFLVCLTQQTPHSKGGELKTECTVFLKKSSFHFTCTLLFFFFYSVHFTARAKCPLKVSLYFCCMSYLSQYTVVFHRVLKNFKLFQWLCHAFDIRNKYYTLLQIHSNTLC